MNKLKKSTAYLAGAIDRCPSGGVGWRNEIKPRLRELGIIPIDPCDKPIVGNSETPEFVAENRRWKEAGEYDKIIARRGVRNEDLYLIDNSSFLIVYLNLSLKPFGTVEEISEANRAKKPILVWMEGGMVECPIWLMWMLGTVETIFSSQDELIDYIKDIDSGVKTYKRFRFLDYDKLT